MAAASVLSRVGTSHAHVIPAGLTSAPAGPPDGCAIDQNAGAAVLRATTFVLTSLGALVRLRVAALGE